jgi:peptidoglycan/xylan/chitin deacetylase (PgdA/CDA1 family)
VSRTAQRERSVIGIVYPAPSKHVSKRTISNMHRRPYDEESLPREMPGPSPRPRFRAAAAALAVIGVAIVAAVVLSSCGASAGTTRTSASPLLTSTSVASTSLTITPTTTAATTTVAPTTTAAPTTTTLPAAAPIVSTGPTDRKWIALTFDDNYDLPRAYATLAVLKEYEVPATVFVIGYYLNMGPDLCRKIAADGFEVGDHTRDHCNCTKWSKDALRIEIGDGTQAYQELTGAPTVALFRPPGGFVDAKTCEVAAENGFAYVVMWDIDTNDWRGRTAAQITHTVLSEAHNGAIVLMHLAGDHTAEALPGIIEGLRADGYELVALSTMLGL